MPLYRNCVKFRTQHRVLGLLNQLISAGPRTKISLGFISEIVRTRTLREGTQFSFLLGIFVNLYILLVIGLGPRCWLHFFEVEARVIRFGYTKIGQFRSSQIHGGCLILIRRWQILQRHNILLCVVNFGFTLLWTAHCLLLAIQLSPLILVVVGGARRSKLLLLAFIDYFLSNVVSGRLLKFTEVLRQCRCPVVLLRIRSDTGNIRITFLLNLNKTPLLVLVLFAVPGLL